MSKNILLVGANSSLGAYVQLRLSGNNLTMTDRTPRYGSYAVDFTYDDSVDDFLYICQDTLFDAVVILTGLAPGRAPHDYSADQIAEVLKVNFSGPSRLVTNVKLRQDAKVIWVSSISALKGSFDPYYAAAKAAANAYMKSRALWDGKNATYITLCPALIAHTRMFKDMTPSRRAFHQESNPTGEFIEPDDIASTICDLINGDWRSANGSIINLSGGSFG